MSKVNMKLFSLIRIAWERQRKDEIPGRLFWQFECKGRQHMLGLPLTDDPIKRLLIFSTCLKKIRKKIGCVIALSATITKGFLCKEQIGVLCSTAGELRINVMDLKFLYVISIYRLHQELWKYATIIHKVMNAKSFNLCSSLYFVSPGDKDRKEIMYLQFCAARYAIWV